MRFKHILILAALNRLALSVPIEPEPQPSSITSAPPTSTTDANKAAPLVDGNLPAPACAGTPENCNQELAKPADVPCEGNVEECGNLDGNVVETIPKVGPEEAPGCGADIPIEDLPIAPGEVLLLSLSLDELKAQVKLQPEVFKKATTPAPGSVLPLIIMESTKENLQAVGINMTKAQIKEDEQKNPDAYMYGPPIAIELAEAAKTLTFQLDIYQTVDAAPEPTPAVPGGGPVPAEATPAVMPADSPYSTGDPKLDDLYAQSDKIMDQINKYQDERQGKMDNQALEVIKQAQGGGGAPTPGGAPVPGDKKPGENGTPAPEDGKPKEGDQAKPSSSTAPVPAPSAPPAMAGQPPAPPAMKAREVKENLLGRDGPHVHHATPKLRVREAQPKSAVRARGLNDKLLGRSGYGHVHHASGRKA